MTQNEIKSFIAAKTNEGLSLSQIQDALGEQGVKMRFMELRMLAAEIESVIAKKEAVKEETEKAKTAEKQKDAPTQDPPEEDAADGGFPEQTAPAEEKPADGQKLRGKTTVTISPIQRPGFLASGTVAFGSGATAEWFLDQTGRLALDNAVGKPDQQDVREFQVELRKAFGE